MVGKMIKYLREQAGHTQLELAKLLGVSRTSITAWENGTNSPTATYLIELSKLYGRSVDYMLGLDRNETVCLDTFNDEEKNLIFNLWSYISNYKQT